MNTIVLIDDDCELINEVKESLSGKFDVKCFEEPAEAFSYLRRYPVSAVILDYQLRKSNGLLVAWDLVDRYPLMPVLFISSDREVEKKIEELKFPHVDFITKPFNKGELNSTLTNLQR